MTQELTDELAFWREAHETAHTKGAALVAWGVYAGLRIAKDGSLDDAHQEMASQLFEQRARIERHIREKVELAGLVAKERARIERLEEAAGLVIAEWDGTQNEFIDAMHDAIQRLRAALAGKSHTRNAE